MSHEALAKAPAGITPHKDRHQSPCFIAKSPVSGESAIFYAYGAAAYWLELIASVQAAREWRLGMRSH